MLAAAASADLGCDVRRPRPLCGTPRVAESCRRPSLRAASSARRRWTLRTRRLVGSQVRCQTGSRCCFGRWDCRTVGLSDVGAPSKNGEGAQGPCMGAVVMSRGAFQKETDRRAACLNTKTGARDRPRPPAIRVLAPSHACNHCPEARQKTKSHAGSGSHAWPSQSR